MDSKRKAFYDSKLTKEEEKIAFKLGFRHEKELYPSKKENPYWFFHVRDEYPLPRFINDVKKEVKNYMEKNKNGN